MYNKDVGRKQLPLPQELIMLDTFGRVRIVNHKADGPGRGRKKCPHCGKYTTGARAKVCAWCCANFPQKVVIPSPTYVDPLSLIRSYGGLENAEKQMEISFKMALSLERAISEVKKSINP
jgi:hypothetical protein